MVVLGPHKTICHRDPSYITGKESYFPTWYRIPKNSLHRGLYPRIINSNSKIFPDRMQFKKRFHLTDPNSTFPCPKLPIINFRCFMASQCLGTQRLLNMVMSHRSWTHWVLLSILLAVSLWLELYSAQHQTWMELSENQYIPILMSRFRNEGDDWSHILWNWMSNFGKMENIGHTS